MNTKELLEKIARYKSAMEAETDTDTKKKFQSRIDQLEKDIAQAEAAVEKKEEKIEKQEDKALEEAEQKLRRYKDAMAAETDADTKAKFQKRIDDLEKQLKGVKEQIKEEKKEIEEQKKDIKEAVQDVQSAQKAVRTQAIKKAGKQVAARKTTATQKKTRKKTIANIISKLDKLIDKSPALKAKYKNARGGSYMQYSKVDLKRDAGRPSKPFGYRFKGDNYKTPRPDQRGQSNVYYEGRANRADVYPKRRYKLDDGGQLADGGLAGHRSPISSGGVVLNLYESGADWKINKPMQREFDDYKTARRMGEKSGAFQYEILDEISGDVLYSTHSEKMTPSLAYKDGGKAKQGYDDREDERLAARRGKTASKDLKGTKAEKEKSRRDDAGFEKKKRGRKKVTYAWKPGAEQKLTKKTFKKGPTTKFLRKKYKEFVEKVTN